ncbi:MAG: pilus assembly protein PilM [Candidatus Aenigmatarchaeota archaeon]
MINKAKTALLRLLSKNKRKKLSKFSTALDIGDFSIKAIKAFMDENGKVSPVSWWISELKDEMDVSVILKECMKKIDYRGEALVTAVGGESVMIRSIDLPYMTDEELRDSIRWEARKHIPIDISNIVFDYQLIKRDPATGNLHVILVAVAKDIFDSHLNMILHAGFQPDIVDVEPLALMNSVLLSGNYGETEDIALIDIGRSLSNFSVFSHDQIYLVRPLSITGRKIEQKLLDEEFVNIHNLRRIMRNEYEIEESYSRDLRRLLEDEIRVLENEIRQNVIFYESRRARVLSKILITGGLSGFLEISGIKDSLSKRLDLELEVFDPFKGLRKEGFGVKLTEKEGPLYALAWGLALRGFRLSKDV